MIKEVENRAEEKPKPLNEQKIRYDNTIRNVYSDFGSNEKHHEAESLLFSFFLFVCCVRSIYMEHKEGNKARETRELEHEREQVAY